MDRGTKVSFIDKFTLDVSSFIFVPRSQDIGCTWNQSFRQKILVDNYRWKQESLIPWIVLGDG